jgi:two-component system, OmpR family, phosphate regulon sensor histidine kinase PhoR
LHNWLRQIVINLLHNSIKFTPKGGQVWVKAKQQGDYIQIEVRDTGIGIPPAEIHKIFDRFYRVRQGGAEEQNGAGLGLSIVHQLLLRCGGSITVKSRPGEGSAFIVLLPLYSSSHKS